MPLPLIQAPPDAFLRMPDIHGSKVVFTCEDDLWLGDIQTMQATRITRHEGVEQYAKFSPDGKQIAFSAQYDGVEEVYVMSVDGGAPKRVTYRNDYAWPLGWTADGRKILFRSRNIPRSFGLYLVPVAGGVEERLPIEFAAHADLAGSGGQFAWTRFNRWSDAWFHYKGGMQNQIWTGTLGKADFKQVTNVPGTNEFPVWSGGRIFFANENDGKFRLMSAVGGRAENWSEASNLEIRELGAGPDAVVYEKGVGLEMLDVATKKITPLRFKLASDLMHTKPFMVSAATSAESMGISPKAKRVLVATRGQIVSLPVGEGEARLWKSVDGARLRMPEFSPDGKLVSYVSDETGEPQIWIAKPDGSEAKALTTDGRRQIANYSWSPDSKWIALNDSEMRLRLVEVGTGVDRLVHKTTTSWAGTPYAWSPDSKWICYVDTDVISGYQRLTFYSIAKSEKTVIGTPFANDSLPAFSRDGRYLAFVSMRSLGVQPDPVLNQLNLRDAATVHLLMLRNDDTGPFALKDPLEEAAAEEKKDIPFRIDFEGLESRMAAVPLPPGTYSQLAFAGNRLLAARGGEVIFYDLAAKKGGTLTPGGGFALSADETSLLVGLRVVPAAGSDVPPSVGALGFGGLTLKIAAQAEWKQMFWDAWRLLRDYFYVANMHGHDWQAVGDKYASFLPAVRSRSEVDVLIRMMQAELGSSHQYLSPGDERSLLKPTSGAFLGIEVKEDQGKVQISKLYRGDGFLTSERSPLLAPGLKVKEGDYLLEIGGQEVTPMKDYRELLAGRAGQTVSILVNSKPTREGSRRILVKPVPNENRMWRLDWVESNRKMVEKLSGGKLGYLYLGAMTQADMSDFVKQFFPQRNKEGLVIDSRFNNGGFVQDMILRVMNQSLSGYWNMRGSAGSWSRQQDHFAGPMAVIQNEFNVSCGEEFTHRFRDLKRGKIFGRRTYGGEVGSSPGWPLVDGGIVSVPNYGMYTMKDGWVIEGPGVSPDVDVPSDPNLAMMGRDLQIEKSVEWLLAEIKRNPPVRPVPPPDPIRIKP